MKEENDDVTVGMTSLDTPPRGEVYRRGGGGGEVDQEAVLLLLPRVRRLLDHLNAENIYIHIYK